MIRYHYLAVFLMLILGACSDNNDFWGKEEDSIHAGDAPLIPVYFASYDGEEGNVATRTTLTENYEVNWAVKDKIGIAAVSRTNGSVVNKIYNPVNAGASSAFKAADGVEMKLAGGKYALYSYYPYSNKAIISNDGKVLFKLDRSMSQSYPNNVDKIGEYDCLYANVSNVTVSQDMSPWFSFTYRHALPMLKFTVTNVNGHYVKSIVVHDPSRTIAVSGPAEVKLEDGTVTVAEREIISTRVLEINNVSEDNNDVVAWMTLCPQVEGAQFEVYVRTKNDDIYEFSAKTLSASGELRAGKCYDLSIDMSKPAHVYPAPQKDTDGSYLLATSDDLIWVEKMVNIWQWKVDARLTDDIDLVSVTNWEPIGIEKAGGRSYEGTFDGAGHTIYNLNCKYPETDMVGLFCKMAGSVKDLHLKDAHVEGRAQVGAIAGSTSGTISGCFVEGEVVGEYIVGGIAGQCGSSPIENCYSSATVTANDAQQGIVGGIVGYSERGNINYCYATGDIKGGRFVGGVCGENYMGNIKGCMALNSSLTCTTTENSIHRVVGKGGDLEACAAIESMEVYIEGTQQTITTDNTFTGMNGASVTADQVRIASTYTNSPDDAGSPGLGWSAEEWGFIDVPSDPYLPWRKPYGELMDSGNSYLWRLAVTGGIK